MTKPQTFMMKINNTWDTVNPLWFLQNTKIPLWLVPFISTSFTHYPENSKRVKYVGDKESIIHNLLIVSCQDNWTIWPFMRHYTCISFPLICSRM